MKSKITLKRFILNCRFSVVFICICLSIHAQAEFKIDTTDSNYLLEKAKSIEGDFEQQLKYAERAAALFLKDKNNKKYAEAQFIVVQATRFIRDSLAFQETIQALIDFAERNNDTLTLVKTHYELGVFYFVRGEPKKGKEALEYPDKMAYYNAESVDANVKILGALVDVSLGFEMNLDDAHYYANRLQRLAEEYDNPSVQIVSRFKMAYLFSKAYDYKTAKEILRGAYPYLDKMYDRGILDYYYRDLINNFIETNEPDSAQYHLQKMHLKTKYTNSDPRSCFYDLTEARVNLALGVEEATNPDFMACLDDYVKELEEGEKVTFNALNALAVICRVHLSEKKWDELDKQLERLLEAAARKKSDIFLMRAHEIHYKSLMARNRGKDALQAHIQFKKYSDIVNRAVFTQGEKLLTMQNDLMVSEEETRLLEMKNANAQLKIQRKNGVIWIVVLGLLLMLAFAMHFRQMYQNRKIQEEKLSRLVEERTAELANLNETLVQTNNELLMSNTELERFAFVASHDLQEPLKTIIGFSNLLEQKLPKGDFQIEKIMGYIKKGTFHMQHLIEDILLYSKYSQASKDFTKVNVEGVIDEVKFSLQEMIRNKNARIKYGELPVITGNKSQLVIIFNNLIANGIKYNESESPTILINYKERQNAHYFEVIDNGIGIESKYQKTVFEMFKRLHKKGEYPGTGIGLSIVKKLIKNHGGMISLESELGRGTKFYFAIDKNAGRESNEAVLAHEVELS